MFGKMARPERAVMGGFGGEVAMVKVRLHSDGSAEVIEPPTADENAALQAGAIRIAEALARVIEERDWAAEQSSGSDLHGPLHPLDGGR
jgi:hypothetical protein